MFIAAVSTVAKLWEEPRCPLTDEWIKKRWSMYTMDTARPSKKKKKEREREILPFAMMRREAEGTVLSEISQSEKDNYHMISLICGI